LWCFTLLRHIDIFIGLGNLNAFAGLVMRLFGKAAVAIYYVIDYMPGRFTNLFLNRFYRRIDEICASHCVTWNYAPGMIKARERDWGKKFPHQLVVPNGIHVRKGIIVPFSDIHKTEIIYMGTLHKQQGIQLMIQALPLVVEKIPSVMFSLIGKGEYRKELENLVKQVGVERHVTFLGFIEDPIVMEKRLAKAAIGLATYEVNGNYVQYTEPGKVKRYLACGVPVVMTDVSSLARQIERASCGFRCAYDTRVLATILISFFAHPERMKEFRNNAVEFAKKSEWERIFTEAFATSMK
jgi:glycosyltransferase involved in cell wall biosynthesis